MTSTLTGPARSGSVNSVATTASQIDELVRTHLPLVGHLVREVAGRVPGHVNRDDLTSAAMFALAASAKSFDDSLGVPFRSFASLRIRGALTDEMRSMDWASRSVRSKGRAVEEARQALTQTMGRVPTDAELAARMNIGTTEFAALQADLHRASVLASDALPPGKGAESVPDTAVGPELALLRTEELGYLRDAIAELPERLRTVIEQYFFAQRLMADIAQDLGVTESRVSQLRSEALSLLRLGMACIDERPIATTSGRQRTKAADAYRTAVANRSSVIARLGSHQPQIAC